MFLVKGKMIVVLAHEQNYNHQSKRKL